MVQPIDPQLGVPTTPNLDIPQITYKKLPFPYQDLTTVPQPDNAQYYPDHIPPVVATVAAMHPSGTQAQELHTNGANALLTSDVNGSGGPSLWAQAIPVGTSRDTLGPLSTDALHFDVPQYFYALGCAVNIENYGTIGPGAGVYCDTVEFWLNEFYALMYLTLGGYYDGTVVHGKHTDNGMYIPPSPIDLSLLGYDNSGRANILMRNNTQFSIAVYIAPVFSKSP